jgi:hypothetical protein
MITDYIAIMENPSGYCDDFKDYVIKVYFHGGKRQKPTNEDFVEEDFYKNYIDKIDSCIDLCKLILPHQWISLNKLILQDALPKLRDSNNTDTLDAFKYNVETICFAFSAFEEEIQQFCSSFGDDERVRINEAFHCYREGCIYSSVAMSVSAVESRLLQLMCIANPSLKKQLEKKTLGQLISSYVENPAEYRDIVPERHKPLLGLCNTYRIFSVHPKKQPISSLSASSILTLALSFLTDDEMKPSIVKKKLVKK